MVQRRICILTGLLATATWLAMEAISFAALSAVDRSWFSSGGFHDQMRASSAEAGGNPSLNTRTQLRWGAFAEVLHPYFGYVADPENNREKWAVSNSGFVFSKGTVWRTERAKDRLVVAVFGGSFANGQYLAIKALLERKSIELKKSVEVVNFSAGGYKQPQQLMILSYMMAAGAKFDIVINIDGFNDVALPLAENVPANVHPFYPRGWERRTANSVSQSDLRGIGKIEFLKTRRSEWSDFFLSKRLYRSPTLCLLWKYRDQSIARTIHGSERKLASLKSGSNSYTARGPDYTYTTEGRLFEDLAQFWKNCSLQMSTLCAANGADYYHFLQPNQYVEGSKPMASGERQRAITNGHPYEQGVVRGYPYLARAGEELNNRGVKFFDLTRIFAAVHEPVYVDDCCHLNALGYDMIAEHMVKVIFRSD